MSEWIVGESPFERMEKWAREQNTPWEKWILNLRRDAGNHLARLAKALVVISKYEQLPDGDFERDVMKASVEVARRVLKEENDLLTAVAEEYERSYRESESKAQQQMAEAARLYEEEIQPRLVEAQKLWEGFRSKTLMSGVEVGPGLREAMAKLTDLSFPEEFPGYVDSGTLMNRCRVSMGKIKKEMK